MDYLCQHARQYLNMDVSIVTAGMHLYAKKSSNNPDPTHYHSTVGGVAIMAFGAISRFLKPTHCVDPSGAGTFVSAQLHLPNGHPPILLLALYAFPENPGPTTVASRIRDYLQGTPATRGAYTSAQEWQHDNFRSQAQLLLDSNPESIAFLGGDLNLTWDGPKHSTLRHLLETDLDLSNLPYFTDHKQPQPTTTFPTIPSQDGRWIDHILHRGPAVSLVSHTTDTPFPPFSDHLPFTAQFNTGIPASSIPDKFSAVETRARQLGKAIHLPALPTAPHPPSSKDRQILEAFQTRAAHIVSHLPQITPATPDTALDNYCDQILRGLTAAALQANLSASSPHLEGKKSWSPTSAFIEKYLLQIHHTYRALAPKTRAKPTPQPRSRPARSFTHAHTHTPHTLPSALSDDPLAPHTPHGDSPLQRAQRQMAGFYNYYRDHDRGVDPSTKNQILIDLFEHPSPDG
jgi:hypothetical protein